ncbi:MAG: sodium:proton exchanger [Candidatus Methylomirabilota bacterium]|nr:MAG: sodium:proton exchanger [candidate division NC10 bacterium]
MPGHDLVRDLLAIFAISIAVVSLFQKIRLPSIAGFLVVGALVGPYGLNLISDLDQIRVVAEIGVVLLLFTIGVEFSLGQLIASRRLLLVAGPLQVIFVLLLVAIGVTVWGVPLREAIFWGCLLSLSSTAIVLKALEERGESDALHGRVTISILIFQDLAVVPMMLFIPLLAQSDDRSIWGLALPLSASAALVVMIVVTARRLVPRLLELIVQTRIRELFLLAIIVLCLGIAWITSLTGLSLALGAFIAGLVISESRYSYQAIAEVIPFRDSFTSLFFVSVGMLMDARVMLNHPFLILGLVGAIISAKLIGGAASIMVIGFPPRVAILSGIALAQVGEFAFILAEKGQALGLLTEELHQLFLAVSVLTMVGTPFLIKGAPRMARRAEGIERLRRWLPNRTIVQVATTSAHGLTITDHVIVVGYGVNGRNLSRVLKETGIPYVILEQHGEIVRREANKGVPIIYGDATNPTALRHVRIEQAKILVVAVSDPLAARRIVQLARGVNSGIHTIVRTRYLKAVDELLHLGADEVVPEEFETSIEIFALVLRTYGVPHDLIMEKAEQIRGEGYEMLRRGSLQRLIHHLHGRTLTNVRVETVRIKEHSSAVGKTIGQLSIQPPNDASIIAVIRGGRTVSHLSEATHLDEGDVVVLLGGGAQIQRASALLSGHGAS